VRPLALLLAVALILTTYDAVTTRRQLGAKDAVIERLFKLEHQRTEVTDDLLSSLESCRDTMDEITNTSQLSVLTSVEDDVRAIKEAALIRRKKKLNRKKKRPFKPVYYVGLGGPDGTEKVEETQLVSCH
jgi:hypothetical protein